MNPNLTDLTILLDRSGSMNNVRRDIIGGFNRLVDDQRLVPGHCLLTLVQFDLDNGPQIQSVYRGVSIGAISPLTDETYVPRGGTPLFDALGHTIQDTGKRLAAQPETQRPGKVVFIVMTDGLENASTEFSKTKVLSMVAHQRDTYQWQFVFMGADIDSYGEAHGLGIATANTMNFAKNPAGVSAAYVSTSGNLRSFRMGAKKDMSFEPKDYTAQADAGATQ